MDYGFLVGFEKVLDYDLYKGNIKWLLLNFLDSLFILSN